MVLLVTGCWMLDVETGLRVASCRLLVAGLIGCGDKRLVHSAKRIVEKAGIPGGLKSGCVLQDARCGFMQARCGNALFVQAIS